MPVPGAWQPQVVAAMQHLATRLGVAVESVAVTRVEKAEWRAGADDPRTRHGLEIWLIGGGRSFRYRASDSGLPTPLGDAS